MSLRVKLGQHFSIALVTILSAGCSAAYQGKVNDAEVHLVDYFQRSEGAQA